MSRIGTQWKESFTRQGKAYLGAQLDRRFISRFMHSPYIDIPRTYAALGPGSRTLEPGCGSGKFSLSFALLGCHAIALDYADEIIVNVRVMQDQSRARYGPLSLQIVQGDLECLHFAADSFDLTINEGVIEHWLDDYARLGVLREMVRVTRPGGAIVVIVPNGCHPLSRCLAWRYYRSEPQMINYNTSRLRSELESLDLAAVRTDGIYAWRWIDQWPTAPPLRWLGGALQRVMPLPRATRERWGINIIAMGRKQ